MMVKVAVPVQRSTHTRTNHRQYRFEGRADQGGQHGLLRSFETNSTDFSRYEESPTSCAVVAD